MPCPTIVSWLTSCVARRLSAELLATLVRCLGGGKVGEGGATQHQGLGTQLLARAEKIALRHGYCKVRAWECSAAKCGER